MSKQDKILRAGFALFSVISSFLFVLYAVSIITGDSAAAWLKIFAYVAGGYGLMNIYILSWAWNSGAKWTVSANLVIAVCFLGAVVMDLLRDGLPKGPQLGAVLVLAVVLGINWFAVKNLCRQDDAEVKQSSRKRR